MLFVSSVLFLRPVTLFIPLKPPYQSVCVQKFSSFSVDSMYEQLNMWHVMLEEYFVFFVCDYPRHLGVGRGIVSFFFFGN